MNKNRQKAIIILALSLFILLGSLSYALWTNYQEQTTANVINAGCFAIELEEQTTAIGLLDSYPLTDEQGATLKPYIFTVRNTCTIAARYEVSLDILNGTTFAMNNIKIKFDYEDPKLIAELGQQEVTKEGVMNNYYLTSAVLAPASAQGAQDGGTKTHYLRLWIDSSVTQMEQQFMGKIAIEASAYTTKIIANGDVSKTKECTDEEECTPVTGNNVYYEFYDDGTLLIKGTGAAAIENDNGILVGEVFSKYLATNPEFLTILDETELALLDSENGIYLVPLLSGSYRYFCAMLEIDPVTNDEDYIAAVDAKLDLPGFKTFSQKLITYFPKIKKILIVEGITEISAGVLGGLGSISVQLPNSLITIGYDAFMLSQIELSFKANPQLREINSLAFSQSNIEQFNIPNSVEIIGGQFLSFSNVKEVSLPQNDYFTTITDGLFDGAPSVETIIIPQNITNITTKAFYNQDIDKLVLKFIGPERTIEGFNLSPYHVEWNYQAS